MHGAFLFPTQNSRLASNRSKLPSRDMVPPRFRRHGVHAMSLWSAGKAYQWSHERPFALLTACNHSHALFFFWRNMYILTKWSDDISRSQVAGMLQFHPSFSCFISVCFEHSLCTTPSQTSRHGVKLRTDRCRWSVDRLFELIFTCIFNHRNASLGATQQEVSEEVREILSHGPAETEKKTRMKMTTTRKCEETRCMVHQNGWKSSRTTWTFFLLQIGWPLSFSVAELRWKPLAGWTARRGVQGCWAVTAATDHVLKFPIEHGHDLDRH